MNVKEKEKAAAYKDSHRYIQIISKNYSTELPFAMIPAIMQPSTAKPAARPIHPLQVIPSTI